MGVNTNKRKGIRMKIMTNAFLFTLLFAATSCLNQEGGQKIPGVNGPDVGIQNGKVVISMELEAVEMQVGVTLPISDKMSKSSVTVSPAVRSDGTFGGTLVRVALDMEDVESDYFKVVPHETLPDGRDFPFTVEGTLPAVAFNVEKAKNTTFYVSKKLFGVFLPIKMDADFQANISYRIKINGEDYGLVSLISPDVNGENAGVLALLTLDDIRGNKGLQKLMRLSKRNKKVLY